MESRKEGVVHSDRYVGQLKMSVEVINAKLGATA